MNAGLPIDRLLLILLVLFALDVGAARWLHDHPQHNPWAPLVIHHPPGWATARKLAAALRDDPPRLPRHTGAQRLSPQGPAADRGGDLPA